MDTAATKLVQSKLKEMGHYSGRIDGDRGPKTHTAVKKGIPAIGGTPPANWKRLSGMRQTHIFLQLYCHSCEINAGAIDGFGGRNRLGPPMRWKKNFRTASFMLGAT